MGVEHEEDNHRYSKTSTFRPFMSADYTKNRTHYPRIKGKWIDTELGEIKQRRKTASFSMFWPKNNK